MKGKIPRIDKLTKQIAELKSKSNHPKSNDDSGVYVEVDLDNDSEIMRLEEELHIATTKGKIPRIDKLTKQITELKSKSKVVGKSNDNSGVCVESCKSDLGEVGVRTEGVAESYGGVYDINNVIFDMERRLQDVEDKKVEYAAKGKTFKVNMYSRESEYLVNMIKLKELEKALMRGIEQVDGVDVNRVYRKIVKMKDAIDMQEMEVDGEL